jgi:hypothetical protein
MMFLGDAAALGTGAAGRPWAVAKWPVAGWTHSKRFSRQQFCRRRELATAAMSRGELTRDCPPPGGTASAAVPIMKGGGTDTCLPGAVGYPPPH